MEENMVPGKQTETGNRGAGCLGEAGWLFSGAVLPMGSLSYYRRSSRKSVGSAILFFVLFTLVISTLTTISFGVEMYSVRDGIRAAYANGEFPEITISHGIAEVDGEQPFIFISDTSKQGERMLIAADTTGKINEIDTSRFDQGLLLTRTDLHFLDNESGYQVIPLSDLHDLFNRDPILINADTLSRLWGTAVVVMVIVAFLFLVLWYTVVRLMIIATIALVLWGVVSLMRPNTGFGPIIVTGLYAIVPAIYLSHLFSRSGAGLPGLQTLFLVGFWSLGLIASFTDLGDRDDRPMRLWTAWIGLPMLVLFVVDLFVTLPSPGGPVALWGVTVLTGLTVAGLRLFFRFNDRNTGPPPVEPAQPS